MICPFKRLSDVPGHPMNILSKAYKRKWVSEPDRKDSFEYVSERKSFEFKKCFNKFYSIIEFNDTH